MDFLWNTVTFPVSGVETFWWLPAVVAFLISFFTSMGGLSGAFILLPFQVSILGFCTPAVSSTNLVYNICSIPGGVYRYIREKRLVWPLVATVMFGIIPGLVVGVFFRVRYLADPKNFKLFVGLVLFFLALKLFNDIRTKEEKLNNSNNFDVKITGFNFSSIRFIFHDRTYKVSTVLIFILSLGVGVISGIYGIGGGAIIAPFLVTVIGLPIFAIAGATLLGTFLSSITGVLIYTYLIPSLMPVDIMVSPDWLLGLSFGIGGFMGIYLGARCQKYFPSRFIKAILAVSIMIVVIRYVGGYFF